MEQLLCSSKNFVCFSATKMDLGGRLTLTLPSYAELRTVAIIKLNFKEVMRGHLLRLVQQLHSGVLGSVVVGRTLFAGNSINNQYKYNALEDRTKVF